VTEQADAEVDAADRERERRPRLEGMSRVRRRDVERLRLGRGGCAEGACARGEKNGREPHGGEGRGKESGKECGWVGREGEEEEREGESSGESTGAGWTRR